MIFFVFFFLYRDSFCFTVHVLPAYSPHTIYIQMRIHSICVVQDLNLRAYVLRPIRRAEQKKKKEEEE